jgi:hypothetical protein
MYWFKKIIPGCSFANFKEYFKEVLRIINFQKNKSYDGKYIDQRFFIHILIFSIY